MPGWIEQQLRIYIVIRTINFRTFLRCIFFSPFRSTTFETFTVSEKFNQCSTFNKSELVTKKRQRKKKKKMEKSKNKFNTICHFLANNDFLIFVIINTLLTWTFYNTIRRPRIIIHSITRKYIFIGVRTRLGAQVHAPLAFYYRKSLPYTISSASVNVYIVHTGREGLRNY